MAQVCRNWSLGAGVGKMQEGDIKKTRMGREGERYKKKVVFHGRVRATPD